LFLVAKHTEPVHTIFMNAVWRTAFGLWALAALAVPCHGASLRVASWNFASASNAAAIDISGTAGILRRLNPDIVLLLQLPDGKVSADLATALQPAPYQVLCTSSFRRDAQGALSPHQAAILARRSASAAGSQTWLAPKQNAPPGGCAFAAVETEAGRIGFFCVQLDEQMAQAVANSKASGAAQLQALFAEQWVRSVDLCRHWPSNGIDAVIAAGSLETVSTNEPDPSQRFSEAAFLRGFLSAPLDDAATPWAPRDTNGPIPDPQAARLTVRNTEINGLVLTGSLVVCDVQITRAPKSDAEPEVVKSQATPPPPPTQPHEKASVTAVAQHDPAAHEAVEGKVAVTSHPKPLEEGKESQPTAQAHPSEKKEAQPKAPAEAGTEHVAAIPRHAPPSELKPEHPVVASKEHSPEPAHPVETAAAAPHANSAEAVAGRPTASSRRWFSLLNAGIGFLAGAATLFLVLNLRRKPKAKAQPSDAENPAPAAAAAPAAETKPVAKTTASPSGTPAMPPMDPNPVMMVPFDAPTTTSAAPATAEPAASAPVQFVAPKTSPGPAQALEQRAEAAEERADKAEAALRAGLVSRVSQWMKDKVVSRLMSDRTKLLEAQEEAANTARRVDERLQQIESKIAEQNQTYEKRIEELTRELRTSKEENREMIRVMIAQVEAEHQAAKAKLEAEAASTSGSG
jgi:hypothetical protein